MREFPRALLESIMNEVMDAQADMLICSCITAHVHAFRAQETHTASSFPTAASPQPASAAGRSRSRSTTLISRWLSTTAAQHSRYASGGSGKGRGTSSSSKAKEQDRSFRTCTHTPKQAAHISAPRAESQQPEESNPNQE